MKMQRVKGVMMAVKGLKQSSPVQYPGMFRCTWERFSKRSKHSHPETLVPVPPTSIKTLISLSLSLSLHPTSGPGYTHSCIRRWQFPVNVLGSQNRFCFHIDSLAYLVSPVLSIIVPPYELTYFATTNFGRPVTRNTLLQPLNNLVA